MTLKYAVTLTDYEDRSLRYGVSTSARTLVACVAKLDTGDGWNGNIPGEASTACIDAIGRQTLLGPVKPKAEAVETLFESDMRTSLDRSRNI